MDNRLPSALAAQAAELPAAWQAAFAARAVADALAAVTAHIEQRLADGAVVYPATPFRALHGLAPSDVVVILGQDPYHGPGQAQGWRSRCRTTASGRPACATSSMRSPRNSPAPRAGRQ